MLLLLVGSRNHDGLQRLTHLDVHLTTQRQHHRGNLLGHLHTSLEVLVDQTLVSYGEAIQMNRVLLTTQILIQLVGIERSKRSQQLSYRHQASIERIVSRTLVVAHFLTPETFAVQTDIPVREVVIDEGVNQSACSCGIIAVQFSRYLLNESIQRAEYPAVDLRSCLQRHCLCARSEAVDIGIQRKEAIRII